MNHCENKYVIEILKSSFHINRLHYSVIAYDDIWFMVSKGGLESFFIARNIIFQIFFRELGNFLGIKPLISVFHINGENSAYIRNVTGAFPCIRSSFPMN